MRGFLKKCRFAPLLAGAFFFCRPVFRRRARGVPRGRYAGRGGSDGRVPKGVTVDGVPVGGMPKRRAEGLRGSRRKNPVLSCLSRGRFRLRARRSVFRTISEILAGAEKGGSYASEIRIFQREAEQAEFICANARRPASTRRCIFRRRLFL